MVELADQPARAAVAGDLGSTLLVEAGAGTGKTRSLVERVVALVGAGHPVSGLAAITFTEAAAGELAERIRAGLVVAERDGRVPPGSVQAIDEAAICTLHAFAQRILAEHPLEAGLPPGFEVLDEAAAEVAFEERWAGFLGPLLDDPDYEAVLLRGQATGLPLGRGLEDVARIFEQHWDRLPHPSGAPPGELAPVTATTVVEPLRRALALGHHCTDADDKLAVHLAGLSGLPARLEGAADELDLLHALAGAGTLRTQRGRAQNFSGCDPRQIREALAEADQALSASLTAVRREVLLHLLGAMAALGLAGAEERRRAGRLAFHDLLVRARDLLRDDPAVRAAVRRRWTHLLIDELQDTDPIQLEVAVLLADRRPLPDGQVVGADLEPGRLFLVGDALQSIYRFRRADVGLHGRTRQALGGTPLRLGANFRSVPGILDWVNAAFGHLVGKGAQGYQPPFEALHAVRKAAPGGPPVVLAGQAHPKAAPIAAVREAEGADLAATIGRIRSEGWAVGGGRPARYGDIALLLPTRTSLAEVEPALERAGVPYRVESASLVWATQEVRDLLSVLSVVADPGDTVAMVAALRSPGLACGDDDLAAYVAAGGVWDLHAPVPYGRLAPDHPVVAGLGSLRALHEQRWWRGLSDLVETAIAELRLFELAFAHARPRDRWRRLRWVGAQARGFEGRGGDLAAFLAWAGRQADDRARAREVVVEEDDDDAVRILTVHGAKGLQFPVVVLAGLNRAPAPRSSRVLWGRAGPEVSLGKAFRTAGFEALAGTEAEHETAERLRVLYVAATRAEDHLVVSLHHKETDGSHADQLAAVCEAHPHLWRRLAPAPEPAGHSVQLSAPRPTPPDSSEGAGARRRWVQRHDRILAAAALAPVRSATAVNRERAGPEDRRRRGGWGPAIGRAVHGVLQAVDLATGQGLAGLAAAHASAEGIASRADEVERLAASALASPSVRDAATRRFWREVYVAAPAGGITVEGFVDLAYETEEGIVVVDYKTDVATGDADLDRLVERYRLQGGAYALALEGCLGRPVAAVRFLFLSGGRARERDLVDVAAAIEDVRQALPS